MADHGASSDRDHRGAHSRSERSAFESLNERLKGGDSVAIQQLFNEYSDKLVRLAAKHIHPALRKRFDGEDVVQSVFRTFFRRQGEGRFQIEQSQQLWKLLVTITLCKTRSQARKHKADRRNAELDMPLVDDRQMLDRQPSPEDAGRAMAKFTERDFQGAEVDYIRSIEFAKTDSEQEVEYRVRLGEAAHRRHSNNTGTSWERLYFC